MTNGREPTGLTNRIRAAGLDRGLLADTAGRASMAAGRFESLVVGIEQDPEAARRLGEAIQGTPAGASGLVPAPSRIRPEVPRAAA